MPGVEMLGGTDAAACSRPRSARDDGITATQVLADAPSLSSSLHALSPATRESDCDTAPERWSAGKRSAWRDLIAQRFFQDGDQVLVGPWFAQKQVHTKRLEFRGPAHATIPNDHDVGAALSDLKYE